MRARTLAVLSLHLPAFPRVLAAFALSTPALALGQVHVVDANGGGDFADIQPAVDAAGEGDVILVRGGHYSSFSVSGKDLVIVAETGATPAVDGALRARNLIASQTLVISGLSS